MLDGPDAADAFLEGVLDPDALDWVRQRSAEARQALQSWPDFEPTLLAVQAALDAPGRIPSLSRRGAHFYNFWQDRDHPRGLWRRVPIEAVARTDPPWELLLDVDALGREEGVAWTFAGVQALATAPDRVLVSLSRGGADAVAVREFDAASRRFIPEGFRLDEAKTDVVWLDADTLLVGTDLGPGSLTDSGYPRQIRSWRRGEPLSAAPIVFEGEPGDVSVFASVDSTPGHERVVVGRSRSFYETDLHQWRDGRLHPLSKPSDARLVLWKDHALMELRSPARLGGDDWPAGALLVAPAPAVGASSRASPPGEPRAPARWTPLFLPAAGQALQGWDCTRDALVLQLLDQVVSRIEEWREPAEPGGAWQRRAVPQGAPATLSVNAWHDPMVADDPLADAYAVVRSGYLEPPARWLHRVGSDEAVRLQALPPQFDAAGLQVEQAFATSADGTRVPYFLVGPEAADAQPRPTLLYGYGGFEISLTPGYPASVGLGWLQRGGRYAVANIRGGGEFGPAWHQAALREHRQRAFDDFAAVAEHLIERGLTTPGQLGIQGGSNGGLLVGAVMLQRPELFGAVVCEVPLLDMRRYHRLLAGASWMAEYGDPDDPADWAFIGRYSPLQALDRLPAGTRLPPMLLLTSTRDDRVHPAHARRMAWRLRAAGQAVLYWENTEGGHAGAADSGQRALWQTLAYAFLWQRLNGQGADGGALTAPSSPA